MSALPDDHIRRVRADFDQIGSFGESGQDRYGMWRYTIVWDT